MARRRRSRNDGLEPWLLIMRYHLVRPYTRLISTPPLEPSRQPCIARQQRRDCCGFVADDQPVRGATALVAAVLSGRRLISAPGWMQAAAAGLQTGVVQHLCSCGASCRKHRQRQRHFHRQMRGHLSVLIDVDANVDAAEGRPDRAERQWVLPDLHRSCDLDRKPALTGGQRHRLQAAAVRCWRRWLPKWKSVAEAQPLPGRWRPVRRSMMPSGGGGRRGDRGTTAKLRPSPGAAVRARFPRPQWASSCRPACRLVARQWRGVTVGQAATWLRWDPRSRPLQLPGPNSSLAPGLEHPAAAVYVPLPVGLGVPPDVANVRRRLSRWRRPAWSPVSLHGRGDCGLNHRPGVRQPRRWRCWRCCRFSEEESALTATAGCGQRRHAGRGRGRDGRRGDRKGEVWIARGCGRQVVSGVTLTVIKAADRGPESRPPPSRLAAVRWSDPGKICGTLVGGRLVGRLTARGCGSGFGARGLRRTADYYWRWPRRRWDRPAAPRYLRHCSSSKPAALQLAGAEASGRRLDWQLVRRHRWKSVAAHGGSRRRAGAEQAVSADVLLSSRLAKLSFRQRRLRQSELRRRARIRTRLRLHLTLHR